MQGKIVLPGWLWIVLLAGIPRLAEWIATVFGAAEWAGPTAAALYGIVAVLKLIFEWQTEPGDKPLPPLPEFELAQNDGEQGVLLTHEPLPPKRSLAQRVFLG